MKLWLDDIRPAPDDTWTHVWSVGAAQTVVLWHEENGIEWTHASLDHDLGADFNDVPFPDGMVFVNWMRDQCRWPTTRPLIHSMNPVGRKNMEFVINRYWTPLGETPL